MKKIIRRIQLGIVCALLMVIVAFWSLAWYYFRPVLVNLGFATEVMIEMEGKEPIVVADPNDAAQLKRMWSGIYIKETPACPFGGVKVSFTSARKTVVLYPAGGDCFTVQVGEGEKERFYHPSDAEIQEILSRYGVEYPFGI